MKFSIFGKVYDVADLESSMTLRDILLFEQQTKDMGRAVTWAQIGEWGDELDALTDTEKSEHPGTIWLTAVTVWASRRAAGEDVTFDQAVNIPMSELRFIPDPEDHRKPNPQKARRKPAKTGSGRAAKPPQAEADADGNETSAEQSVNA